MGRDSGFVAMHAATAADVVDLCMIPEVKVDMKEMQLRKKKRKKKVFCDDGILLGYVCGKLFFCNMFFLIFKPVLVEG